MVKFKVGDKVIRVKVPNDYILVGGIGTVSYASQCGNSISLDGIDFTFHPGYFELYKESEVNKPTPHKHAEVIKAWADGAEIEYRSNPGSNWVPTLSPSWFGCYEYRVKPEPKPDVVRYSYADVQGNNTDSSLVKYGMDNLKLTFDGETGKLKAAEVI